LEEDEEDDEESSDRRRSHNPPPAPFVDSQETLPSLKMSLSDSSLQPPTVGEESTSPARSPTTHHLPNNPNEEYEDSMASPPPSMISSQSSAGPAPHPVTATGAGAIAVPHQQPVSPTSSVSNRKLQQILFGESIASLEQGGGSFLGGTSTSLYELSGSIESLETPKSKEKKVFPLHCASSPPPPPPPPPEEEKTSQQRQWQWGSGEPVGDLSVVCPLAGL
jgi:hypothetical protein